MAKNKVLYISGSLGLGHITRDLAITKELRRLNSGIEISWLAGEPANILLKDAGEHTVPEADSYISDNITAENASRGFRLNLFSYTLKVQKGWQRNGEVFKQLMDRESFDLIIGDESYEVATVLKKEPQLKKWPFVWMTDFVGLDSMTNNPLEKMGVYMINRSIIAAYKSKRHRPDLSLFIGELEDIPDKRFGIFLPNRRAFANNTYEFVGNVLPFDPADYLDKNMVRARLGYGKEPLLVCSIGGTTIGKELLELCAEAYPIIKQKISNIRIVLVCGPRLLAKSLKFTPGVEVREYVPALYEHFAASDLAIIQGGGTTTLELTALRRPFLYFPLESHCEQEVNVAGRLTRHQAGIKMAFSQTTPASLAEKVITNLGREVTYPPILTDGARRAAQFINSLL